MQCFSTARKSCEISTMYAKENKIQRSLCLTEFLAIKKVLLDAEKDSVVQ